MRDEGDFPTVRFRKCSSCGKVYTGSLTGADACPICHTSFRTEDPSEAAVFRTCIRGHVHFIIQGPLRKLGQLEDLRGQIDGALADNADSIAFAFESASFLNSSLINLLVKTMQTLSIVGKPTFIVTRDADTLESLQMMDLDRVMRILPDRESYLAALA
ncbi:MAG: hypothetical protein JF616_05285 [Fibrobacteres bacterium]|nr:hypothetical protein [Fibrobacterota bacterium]